MLWPISDSSLYGGHLLYSGVQSNIHEMSLLFQVCCVQFDRKDISMNKLVATTLESRFYVWDMRTQHPTKGFSSLSEKVNM